MTTALYSGSFDPVTYGHLDVIRRAARLFDVLVVAVGVHHAKKALFDEADRIAMIEAAVAPIVRETGARIIVAPFAGLVVDAAKEAGAAVIVRGIRNTTDLDYEMQMERMNAAMAPGLEVVYLAAAPEVRHIASSLVRQVAALGGPLDAFVPPHVAERLRARHAP
jgi:pantetheine-phosphate adenylyltransferase